MIILKKEKMNSNHANNKKVKTTNISKTKDNNSATFNNYYEKQKKFSNAEGINNNKN